MSDRSVARTALADVRADACWVARVPRQRRAAAAIQSTTSAVLKRSSLYLGSAGSGRPIERSLARSQRSLTRTLTHTGSLESRSNGAKLLRLTWMTASLSLRIVRIARACAHACTCVSGLGV